MIDYWTKQSADKPAFDDLLWSKPERRDQAGKLLVVGGNKHAFNAPAQAYSDASTAGIGVCRVLLPNSLRRTIGKLFPEAEYANSTPSGSFAKSALIECLELAAWSDGILLAGDFGHNSETAVLLELFLQKYSGPATLTKDAADYFLASSGLVLDRANTILVITMAELQKLATDAQFTPAITSGMDLLQLITALHDLTASHPASLITKHNDNIIVASAGQVSTTKTGATTDPWRVKTAAHASTWLIQHPAQPFQAITTSVIH